MELARKRSLATAALGVFGVSGFLDAGLWPLDATICVPLLPVLAVSMAVSIKKFKGYDELSRWQRLANSPSLAPITPTIGFSLLVAEQRPVVRDDQAAGVQFQAVEHCWEKGEDELWGITRVQTNWWPVGDESVTVPFRGQTFWSTESDISEVAAAWFEFCQIVEQTNEQRWAAQQQVERAEEQKMQLQAEAAKMSEALPSAHSTSASTGHLLEASHRINVTKQ